MRPAIIPALFMAPSVILSMAGAASAGEFAIAFNWSGLELCTSGQPNKVKNPSFALSDVPQGTAFIRFKLVDLNVPGYNHGGGRVPYSGQPVIKPGGFTYKSPCPPNGTHTYEWTATALATMDGPEIGTASAALDYP